MKERELALSMNKSIFFFTLVFLLIFFSGCSQSKDADPLKENVRDPNNSPDENSKTNLANTIDIKNIKEVKISITSLPKIPNPDTIGILHKKEHLTEFYNAISNVEVYNGPNKDLAANYDLVIVYKDGSYRAFQYWNEKQFRQLKDIQTSKVYLLDTESKQKLDNLLNIAKIN
jgi:hypothetical protein